MVSSGEGSEKENLAAEKEFETAVAKGYRPCKFMLTIINITIVTNFHPGPTCQKMMDLRSSDKVFKISTFQPSEEELNDYIRSKRKANSSRQGIAKKEKARSPSPVLSIPDELSDSDEEFPEVSQMFNTAKKGKMKAKLSQISDIASEVYEEDVGFLSSSTGKPRLIYVMSYRLR
jgi:hypothetical protein